MNMNYYITAFKKFAVFSGRASRTEYWMFALFHVLAFIVAIILDNMLGTAIEGVIYGLFYFAYALVTVVPSISLATRRLHDVGKSGWMFLVNFIPIIGGIWFLILMVSKSEAGANKYGPNPSQNRYSAASAAQ